MLSTKTIGIIIGIIVIGGGIWYTISDHTDDAYTNVGGDEHEGINTQQEYTATSPQSGSGSLASLFGRGERVRCEFSSSVDGQLSQGVFYTDGDHFRVDATHQADGETLTSNIINNGEYTYTWGSSVEGQFAIKMRTGMAGVAEAHPPSSTNDTSVVDIDANVMYTCAKWAADPSLFVPPSSVTFMDIEAMMQGQMPEGFTYPTMQ